MKKLSGYLLFIAIHTILLFSCSDTGQKSASQEIDQIPHLAKQGHKTQLMIDGRPFIIRGGELGNSTFTSMESTEFKHRFSTCILGTDRTRRRCIRF